MIWLTPLAAALALGGAAAKVRRCTDAASARSTAAAVAMVVAGGTAALTLIELQLAARAATAWLAPPAGLALVPLVFATVALVAVSLAPLASHPPRTMARVLLLVAAALTAVATDVPAVIVAAWLGSTWVAWSEVRERAGGTATAQLFASYHAASSACLLAGTAALAAGFGGAGVALLIVGIAIREAVLPLHSWLPAFVAAMPLGIVVAFVAPQLGVYAHLSLLAAGIPTHLASSIAAVGASTAVVAAGLGIVQHDPRRALAFLVISQTGLVAFGLENHSPVALTGALATWQVLALATAGFAMTLAAIEARRGSLSLREPSGNFARTPRMAVAFLVLGFASVGFPTTFGFVAEDLLVQGSVAEHPVLGFVLIVATALNGITVMRAFLFLFSGSSCHAGEVDLRRREIRAVTAVMALLLLAGLFPQPVVSILEPRSATIHAAVTREVRR